MQRIVSSRRDGKSQMYFKNGLNSPIVTTPWTPQNIGSSLVGWWDASDSSTITTATGVSSIADKTTNARPFFQSSGALQPTRVANTLNNLSVLRFDGTDDWMQTSTRINIRCFVLLARWTNSNTVDYRHLWDMSTNSVNGWHGDTVASGRLLSTFTSPFITNGSIYINGTLTSGFLSRYTAWTLHIFETTNIIDPQFTGYQSTTTPSRTFIGDIAEWMYLNAVPSTVLRQQIEGYLAHKYNLTPSLPNSHPHKTSVPAA
jgi:hypothetical protein